MSIMLEYTLIHVVQVWPLAMNQGKAESKCKDHKMYCKVMQTQFIQTEPGLYRGNTSFFTVLCVCVYLLS